MFILASGSPRRKELIGELTDEFSVQPTDAKEVVLAGQPSKTVMKNAKAKAMAAKYAFDNVVIAADTIVYMDGKYYLKPKTVENAKLMLRELNGRKHYVYTGVCVIVKGKVFCFYDKSAVVFKNMTEREIDDYVLKTNPVDKAGAYGIQDKTVVDSFSGSYSNIVGLPMEKLKVFFAEMMA